MEKVSHQLSDVVLEGDRNIRGNRLYTLASDTPHSSQLKDHVEEVMTHTIEGFHSPLELLRYHVENVLGGSLKLTAELDSYQEDVSSVLDLTYVNQGTASTKVPFFSSCQLFDPNNMGVVLPRNSLLVECPFYFLDGFVNLGEFVMGYVMTANGKTIDEVHPGLSKHDVYLNENLTSPTYLRNYHDDVLIIRRIGLEYLFILYSYANPEKGCSIGRFTCGDPSEVLKCFREYERTYPTVYLGCSPVLEVRAPYLKGFVRW